MGVGVSENSSSLVFNFAFFLLQDVVGNTTSTCSPFGILCSPYTSITGNCRGSTREHRRLQRRPLTSLFRVLQAFVLGRERAVEGPGAGGFRGVESLVFRMRSLLEDQGE
jgi:hypothetical protein